jgi:hypothetical protein
MVKAVGRGVTNALQALRNHAKPMGQFYFNNGLAFYGINTNLLQLKFACPMYRAL